MRRSTRSAIIAAGSALLLVLSPVGPADAASSAKRPPVPTVSVTGLPSPRLDQVTTQTMVARGASRLAPVTVLWGDGSETVGTSPCTRRQATTVPDQCTVAAARTYLRAGTYAITVKSGERVVARTQVVVRPAAQPWTPPAGFVPSGWAFFGRGATYAPCATVNWYYDRSREPAAAVGMHDEVVAGLAVLAAQTGLTFIETDNPIVSRLTYRWDELAGTYADAAGVGGRSGGQGSVTFNLDSWWPTDQWPGFGVIVQPDGSSSVGRGWLVVHETMHALGMAHVNDPTAVMNPVAGASAFSAGDLDGLRTMYLNNPCPT